MEKPGSLISDEISLTNSVRNQVEALILNGRFEPGDRINELALAEEMGTSRGPIREAMRALENAGLVLIVPNRGVVVRTLELEEALELYDVRAGLACSAGRLLAARATSKDLEALEQLHRRMAEAIDANDVRSFQSLNHNFHDSMLSFAGNSRLQELDLKVRNELQLYIRRGVMGDAQLRVSNAEHARILKAVRDGNQAAAGKTFEQHILNGKQRMLENARAGFLHRRS